MEGRAARELVEADTPDESAFSLAFADAYRDCALQDADMRAVATALEAVRDARRRNREPFPTWRELDDQIGRCTDNRLLDVLVTVRDRYEGALFAAYTAWLTSADFETWMDRLGSALSAWRLPICQLLATQPPAAGLSEADAASAAALPAHLARMSQDDWDLAMPAFDWLGAHPNVANEDRARMHARAAQVELYFTQDVERARIRMERGAELACDAHSRAEVECVRAQCLRADKKVPEAILELERAAATDARFDESFAYRGDIALEANDLSSAESWYRSAVSARPGSDMGYMRLVRLLARSELIAERGAEIPALVERAAIVTPLNAAEDFSSTADVMREGNDLESAMRFAERAVAADPRRGRARYARGLVHAARGDWLETLRDFRFALQHEPTKYSRARWYALGVEDARGMLLDELANDGDDPLVRDALLCYVEQSNGNPERLGAALAVLDALGEHGAPPDDRARAVLANARGDAYYYARDYTQASAAFAEAWRLDPTSAVFGTNLVAAYRELRQWDAAFDALSTVFEVTKDSKWRSVELATIANGRANDLYDLGRYAVAAELYAEAASLRPDEPVYRTNQVLALEQLIGSATNTLFLDDAIGAMEHVCTLLPDDASHRARFVGLRDLRRGVERYGIEVLQRPSTVAPIRIYIAKDLTPFVSSDREAALEEELSASIGGLRSWIADDYGIELPPISFAEAEEAEPGTYVLELHGVATRAERLRADRRLLTGAAAVAAATAAGVTGERAASPLNGDAALWIAADDWNRVVELGLSLWSIMEYALYDLAYQVLRRLKEFVGHTEVAALLTAKDVAGADVFLANPVQLSRLVRVLHGLLAERVPIAALGGIAALVAAAPGERASVLVQRARLLPDVRRALPGRSGACTRMFLTEEWEAALAGAIRNDGDDAVLTMTPDLVQKLIQVVREIVARAPGVASIVVRDTNCRAPLRRIVEDEFPQLWIVAASEIDDLPTADAAPAESLASIAVATR